MKNIATVLLCITLMACSSSSVEKASDIQPALDRLIANPDRENRFVVIEHQTTKKFVQFHFSDEEISIDVPIKSLTKEELERASTLFASFNVSAPVAIESNLNDGQQVTDYTFQLGFGNDSAKATAFANRIFREVYLLSPDSKFDITEDGWSE